MTARSAGAAGAAGSGSPAPRSAASRAAAGSASVSQTAEPRSRRARATEVPIRPVPMMMARTGRSLSDVEAQRDRAAQVDVLDGGSRAGGLDVRHQADDAGHGPRPGDL